MRYVLLGLGLLIVVALAWANLAGEPLSPSAYADRVVVHKADRRLDLMAGDVVLKSYPISLGGHPVGHKQREGDERTPEGTYVLDYRNPGSSFHKSLHVSYPSSSDKQRAAAVGDDPGGLIMVHGMPNGFGWLGRLHLAYDWTEGCVAVTSAEIEEIWNSVRDGTPIEIRP
jgi:murein L,D-transpeptidase YafK